ncbi:MAG: hypothetical protein AVDCRST_MAG25-2717 [uncultured Rubrobacteraceae bacterium]|uniref:Uncharacterized protein n=1 Tax=uncultured Rubrobacteraceae bacterium TaxID=349277 RepID=A0A6J4RT12_9ACTN|nr:MAG: hypothetical protein AVDCRST_MAG25-2717 [uncultured Rubrobacteraceae bacterium]
MDDLQEGFVRLRDESAECFREHLTGDGLLVFQEIVAHAALGDGVSVGLAVAVRQGFAQHVAVGDVPVPDPVEEALAPGKLPGGAGDEVAQDLGVPP